MTRYALRVDANQASIVEALRAAGAKVKVVHHPFDLQVWTPVGATMYFEVKNPKTGYGKRGMNERQAESAQGLPVAMVDSVEAALRAYKLLNWSKE